jgi:cyclic beta-1,2-glucan synthetase
LAYVPASAAGSDLGPAATDICEPLEFDNGIGGFAAGGREYVIRLHQDGDGKMRLPPQPWTNVIANEQAGCLVTERGGGYTWVGNSRNNRLTAWHNDPVCDPLAEAIWIRDEAAGVFWSPLPGPTPAQADYEVRHGFGYTKFRHESHELTQETTVFVAVGEPLKFTRLRLVNRSNRPRQLAVFSYLRWVLGTTPAECGAAVTTVYDEPLGAILARNPSCDGRASHVAFSAAVLDARHQCTAISHTADGRGFLGPLGDLAAPAAIATQQRLDHHAGSVSEPCAAWQLSVEVGPGESFECTFLLGETADAADAAELIQRFRGPERVAEELDKVIASWRNTLSAVEIETPNRELDFLVNGWLVYQNLSCRLWGRSAYYQSGGAFGFRDQLQDAAALVYHRPDLTRGQILRHAAQQFAEGDVFHWWHPDTGDGLRTRFSDDLLWLPLLTAEYVRTTGDTGLLDEVVPFVTARPLADGEQEAFLRGQRADSDATLYEHCCRALDRGLTTGPHGLPLIGCGDWNDGMNRVGRLGRGESVWLGFFSVFLLDRFLPFCRQHGDQHRADRYTAYRDRLVESLNTVGWDGDWYRRAYYDDGSPIGSAANTECRIDALVQAWAVLSGAAPADRVEKATQAVDEWLVDDQAGLIRLLTPPFDRTPHDPGYIKGYLPGIRENGGQYTHGVLWFIRALAELGRGSRAVELLRMLSPVSHTDTAAGVAKYQAEPYVVAADVYGEPPHVGRGGWTWYTGSAGWMWRVAVESILGLSIDEGRTLVLDPAISSRWPHCRLSYRLPDGDTQYEIMIENPAGKETGVTLATVDGQPAQVAGGAARIPIERDGRRHQVVVRL